MNWFNELVTKAARLSEKSFFWKQFFAWAPPLALVFGIDWLVTSYFSSLDPETADSNRRNAMILIGVIALCLSLLLRSWAKKDDKSNRDGDED